MGGMLESKENGVDDSDSVHVANSIIDVTDSCDERAARPELSTRYKLKSAVF